MHTVCASNVLYGAQAFSTLGRVTVLPEKDIVPGILRDADLLVIRSGVTVGRELLAGSRVRFVGTATSGFDHLDVAYLQEAGIGWVHAPGCNARSVAEYVVCALLVLAQRHGWTLSRMTLGVVGVGEIGGRVVRLAEALGMTVLQNDPPKFLATGDPIFCELKDVLSHADVVSLHVPLERGGPFPTWHMADHRFFARMRPGAALINTARGEVVDAEALRTALEARWVEHAVLDVWENEPYVDPRLVERVDLATPHIAGYSLEGRLAGTVAVYRAACHFFEEVPRWEPPPLPPPGQPEIVVDARGRLDEEVLHQVARAVYDIEADDRWLREAAREEAHACAARFVLRRLEYPARREFASAQVRLRGAGPGLCEKVRALGFRVAV